ncbi:uncharacterized protein KNAG_0G02850 [Huiozyma naganishii CBS 8797]|uniref:Uncharacterized protein n=1 Tax=Huiozyma naganishii (strain ATCC MYA-139 / BCRC 22969 / CBS 8797 / KCTC 17520 / NBRC 10181 / NCYC 3082 / Yp74L-3) TaxID=1071383 RepID=J7S967_HUIN7|nr:hypothetical protein KNAG_0G02850 [Kazachstania naganishii CBS 8797]CCK71341.1 hypothetical protein KNAG_0G02850 [Kazachstania naganishii CBS 8797]
MWTLWLNAGFDLLHRTLDFDIANWSVHLGFGDSIPLVPGIYYCCQGVFGGGYGCNLYTAALLFTVLDINVQNIKVNSEILKKHCYGDGNCVDFDVVDDPRYFSQASELLGLNVESALRIANYPKWKRSKDRLRTTNAVLFRSTTGTHIAIDLEERSSWSFLREIAASKKSIPNVVFEPRWMSYSFEKYPFGSVSRSVGQDEEYRVALAEKLADFVLNHGRFAYHIDPNGYLDDNGVDIPGTFVFNSVLSPVVS